MRKLLTHLTHGGQTWLHHVRLTGQVLLKVGKLLFSLWFCLTLLFGWFFNGSETMINTLNKGLASLLMYLGLGTTQLSVPYQGQKGIETAKAIVQDPYYSLLIQQSLWHWALAAFLSAGISMLFYWGVSRYFSYRGKQLSEDTFIRGTQVVSTKVLAKQVRRKVGASDIKLDGVPLPKGFEVGHLFIHGTTGAGKSQVIMKLLHTIRQRGDKVILPDAGGMLTRYFYREGEDCLLSPLDKRGVDWHCWSEGNDYAEYSNMAKSLIPMSSSEDSFWVNAARSLFAHALDKMKKESDRSHSKLLSLLLQTPLEQLAAYFAKTDASMIANKEIEKTTTCVRTVIAIYLKSLRLLDKRAESIRYGVITQPTVPSDYAMHCHLNETDDSGQPLTGCLVWIKLADKILAGRLYTVKASQLCQVSLPSDHVDKIAQIISQSTPRLANNQKFDALLCGHVPKQRAVIEQLHQLTHTASPFPEMFSIRQWMADDSDQRWLFMPYTSDQRHAMRPLLSLWLDLACMNLLQRTVHPEQKVWIILDELPTLHRLPSLDSMAEGRKFGGCFVLGVQSISQMWKLYGSNTTRTLFNLSNTRLFFRSNDPDIARWSSQALGQQTLKRCQQNYSYGANRGRDGVSVNHQYVDQATVTAAEIQSLKNLDYYLSLSGDLPITKQTLTYQSYRTIVEPFNDIVATSEASELDQVVEHYAQQSLPRNEDPLAQTSPATTTEKASDVIPDEKGASGQQQPAPASLANRIHQTEQEF